MTTRPTSPMTGASPGSQDPGDGLPVVHPDACRATELAPGVVTSTVLGPHRGSPLTLTHARIDPGAAWRLTSQQHADDVHLLVYVLGGAGTLEGDAEPPLRLRAGSA